MAEVKESPAFADDGPDVKEDGAAEEGVEVRPEYLRGIPLALVMACTLFANILSSLDATILAAAMPTIANDLNTLKDVGWFGSAYLLAAVAFQPVWGKALASFSIRWVWLASFVIFELGSVVCAVAKTPAVFILGRSVAGTGGGGMFIGILAIYAACLPLRWQPLAASVVSASWGIGASSGPVIGGAITSLASWPWCFYLNLFPLPLIVLIVVFYVKPPPRDDAKLGTLRQRLLRIDFGGSALLLAAVVMLLLALQDAGVAHAWKSARIIGLLVGFFATGTAYVLYQLWLGDNASLSLRLLKNKNVAFAAALFSCIGYTWTPVLMQLPIYFQAVKGTTALGAGTLMIALNIPNMVASLLTGALVTSTGQFQHPMRFGAIICPIVCGLLSTLEEHTSTAKIIGYQVLIGFAMGALYMQPYMASQFLVKPEQRPASATLVISASTLAGTMSFAVVQSIYQNLFYASISEIEGLDAKRIIDSGLTAFRTEVPPELLPLVTRAASKACQAVFWFTAAVAATGFICSLFIDRPPPRQKKLEKAEKAEESDP